MIDEIKILKKENKKLKIELGLSENELKVETKRVKELEKINQEYSDMISQAIDWVHFEFKDALDDNNLSQVILERCKIKEILKINYELNVRKK